MAEPAGRSLRLTTKLACVAAILLCTGGVAAHHSFSAEFDANRKVTLRGTIVRMDWFNPHCWLWIDVSHQDGHVEHWVLELGPPNALIKRGFRKTTLVPGQTVTATAYPAKDGRRFAILDRVTLSDGTVLGAGPVRSP